MTSTSSSRTGTASTQPTTPLMWWIGVGSTVVSAGAAIQLVVLAERTDDFFAWTIAVPVSAAFIGLFYLATTVMGVLGTRQPWWAPARAALIPVIGFVALVLAATLIHLEEFHLFSGGFPARAAAWAWLAIYVVTVPMYLFGFWWQRRAPGGDPPRTVAPPRWARMALAGLAVVLAVVGLALFAAPSLATTLWPWRLAPLSARMTGVTLVSLALLAAAVVRIDDRTTGRIPAIGLLTFGLSALAVLARYSDLVAWAHPSAWAFVAVAIALAVVAFAVLPRSSSRITGNVGDRA